VLYMIDIDSIVHVDLQHVEDSMHKRIA
jgi:hypothetical protein